MPRSAAQHRPRGWRPSALSGQKSREYQALYNSAEWRQVLRPAVLRQHRFCQQCLRDGRKPPRVSKVVDHIRPHKGDRRLFFDRRNLEGLCNTCHSRKTALHDGGYGRPIKPPPAARGGRGSKVSRVLYETIHCSPCANARVLWGGVGRWGDADQNRSRRR
ncbi:MAG: HNH endonuclease signature motif containing protein [Planctomycetaceae bacterium]